MKLIVGLFILFILISLFSALMSIIRAKSSTRVAKMLTIRIVLSLGLFVLLVIIPYTQLGVAQLI